MRILDLPGSHLVLAIILLTGGWISTLPISSAQCTDCDGDGFTYPTDCNDASDQIYPGQTETCNGFDDDCDGEIDEAAGCLRDCPYPDAQAPPLLPLGGGGITPLGPDMAWSGQVLALASENRDAYPEIRLQLTRLTPDGALLGHTDLGRVSTAVDPDVVWTGEAFAVAWVQHYGDPAGNQAMLARVDAGGAVLGTPVNWRTCGISVTGDTCKYPRLAWSGDRFGAIWLNPDLQRLQFMALAGDGDPIPGTEVDVTAVIRDDGDIAHHDIAPSGGVFGVVWRGTTSYFRRLSPDGVPQGQTTILPAGWEPKVVAGDQGWAVAQVTNLANSYPFGAGIRRGQLLLLDDAGVITAGPTVPGPPPPDSVGQTEDVRYMNLEWTGSQFGMIYAAEDSSSWPPRDLVMLSRFSAGGVFLATDRITLDRQWDTRSPQAAWTGDRYAVNWYLSLAGERVMGTFLCDCSLDGDGDGSSSCSDCDDDDPAVYSYGVPVCDGINNNCYHDTFPALGPGDEDFDDDGDGFSECTGDCQDLGLRAVTVYPSAPQLCGDELNNDCDHPAWPSLDGTNEVDMDSDLYTGCEGDCDDANGAVRPYGLPLCDGLNNNCSDPVWPGLAGTEEMAGGVCEATGGVTPVIDLTIAADGTLHWQSAAVLPGWNVYRGDLADLECDLIQIAGSYHYRIDDYVYRDACLPSGGWMQAPGSNALAAQTCNVQQTSLGDEVELSLGQVATFLVTGTLATGPDAGLGHWLAIKQVLPTEGVRPEEAACP